MNRRFKLNSLLIVIALSVIAIAVATSSAATAQITNRSITISSPDVSATVVHTFNFTLPVPTTVGSIEFEYCDSPLRDIPCSAPAGLDVSGAQLNAQTGATGFGIMSQTANDILLSRGTNGSVTGAVSYAFTNAVNPSFIGTFYVRVFTYDSTDGTGPDDGFGAMANSTTRSITLNTVVPPILDFCVGQSIPGDCSTASGNLVELGDLSSSQTASGTSQMMAATNAQFGLDITVQGSTMTSGNNIIPALTQRTNSAPGNAQFGINLRANNNPHVGANPGGVGVANPTVNYNSVDNFMFHSGDVIASTPFTTDVRKFTTSYIVNVPPAQPAGVYGTTINYICTASF